MQSLEPAYGYASIYVLYICYQILSMFYVLYVSKIRETKEMLAREYQKGTYVQQKIIRRRYFLPRMVVSLFLRSPKARPLVVTI